MSLAAERQSIADSDENFIDVAMKERRKGTATSTRSALELAVAETNDALDKLLTPGASSAAPERLFEAMRYACLGGGKRFRPALVFAAAQAAGATAGARPAVLRLACAVEMVHAQSLVFDDLPAMDDDDLRRGRPSVHRAFDEATAMLCACSLLVRSFEVLADSAIPSETSTRLTRELAGAVGWNGLAAGQMRDLGLAAPPDQTVGAIHDLKTSALIRACCVGGAIAAHAPSGDVERLSEYGRNLGMAFQAVDDILDAVSSADDVGKATGKDHAAGKRSLTASVGVDAAVAEAKRLAHAAVDNLRATGRAADPLRAIARLYVFDRLPAV